MARLGPWTPGADVPGRYTVGAVDRAGVDLCTATQGHLTWPVTALLPVKDVVPVPTGALRSLHVQGVDARDVALWRGRGDRYLARGHGRKRYSTKGQSTLRQ